jgi:ribonuclease Z
MHERERIRLDWRWLLAGIALAGLTATASIAAEPPQAAGASADSMVVTLLGTGDPVLSTTRYGMSTLVQAGGLNLVFDAGRGCAVRLDQAGIRPGNVDAVFITHFHSDHLNGLPDLWTVGYLGPPVLRRAKPLEIWGPAGIARITASLRDTYIDDVKIRLADEKVSDAGTQILAHEFSADGAVFERNGVRITAFAVNHGPLIKPAYGYRVDFAGRSVLLSGDTKFDENLIAHGAGVDLLIHEVAIAPKPLLDAPWVKAIINHHTTPEEAGVVFSRTKPQMAVFSHITLIADANNPRPEDSDIEARTRASWSGNLVVGADLTRFVLTADAVSMKRFDHATGGYEK